MSWAGGGTSMRRRESISAHTHCHEKQHHTDRVIGNIPAESGGLSSCFVDCRVISGGGRYSESGGPPAIKYENRKDSDSGAVRAGDPTQKLCTAERGLLL